MAQTTSSGPAFQHIALMVRDIEKSHRFYTEALGFEQCAQLDDSVSRQYAGQLIDFRFYRACRSTRPVRNSRQSVSFSLSPTSRPRTSRCSSRRIPVAITIALETTWRLSRTST